MITKYELAFTMNTWWLAVHIDSQGEKYYRLHGNNGLDGTGNPRFFAAEMVTSSRLRQIKWREGTFYFETMNSTYACSITDHINERYGWLFEQSLWDTELQPKEMQKTMEEMKNNLRERRDQTKTVTELPAERYCIMAFGDQHSQYFADALWREAGEYVHCKRSIIPDGKNGINVIYFDNGEGDEGFAEKRIGYRIIGKDTIEINGADFMYMPIFITNCGNECLYLDTIYGRYYIPNGGKTCEISVTATDGRVAVYEYDENGIDEM